MTPSRLAGNCSSALVILSHSREVVVVMVEVLNERKHRESECDLAQTRRGSDGGGGGGGDDEKDDVHDVRITAKNPV